MHAYATLLFLLLVGMAPPALAQRFRELRGHFSDVNAVAFLPDGQTLLTASSDKTLAQWNAASGELVRRFNGHTGSVNTLSVSANGQTVASGSSDRSIRVWDLNTGAEIKRLDGHNNDIEQVSFGPDNATMASVGHDRELRLWDLHQNWMQVVQGHNTVVYGVAFSLDGQRVATCGADKRVRLWDVNTGQEKLALSGHSNTVRSVAFSPDGEYLASGGLDGQLIVWSAANGSMQKKIAAHQAWVRQVAFSPDGSVVATASRDGTAKVFDVRNGQELLVLKGHVGALWAVAFSPDGKTLATASADKTVRLWDVSFLNLGSAAVATSYRPQENRFDPPIDVAANIPEIGTRFSNRFALIIGNEYYSQHQPGLTAETDVEFARQDALLFKQYAEQAMGIPNKNILMVLDATAGQMRNELMKLSLLAQNYGPEAELYVYYAGHGIPMPQSNEPLLLPVDVNANQPQQAVPLREVLEELTKHPTARNVVFLDACFSGLARNASPLAARGVRVKSKPLEPTGNTLVIGAAGPDQPALPYRQARHGLFTYFLLKALNEGYYKLDYGMLTDEVFQEVSLHALLIHNRAQNPNAAAAMQVGDEWRQWAISE